MIKKLIINYRTSKNEKNRKIKSAIEFSKSKHIGLIIHEEFEDQDSINSIIEDLKNNNKRVSKIYFLKKPKGHEMSPWFKASQINLIGQVKSPELDHFLKQDFDFLLCLDESNHYILDYVISMSTAPSRIGVMTPDRTHFYEMMVSVDNQQMNISTEMLRYLKKI